MTNDELIAQAEAALRANDLFDPLLAKLIAALKASEARGKGVEEVLRADLLPVVKPLVWVIDTADSQFAKWQWTAETYLIEERNHAPNVFDLICSSWDFEDAKRFESLEAAQAAAQADYEARIRASLDMIDPAALVAGAYEAAIRACINMDLLTEHPNDAGAIVLRVLTPADAQAALDAAITKAVNAKLDAVATRSVEWAMKNPDEDMILNVFAEEILAMKEEG